MGSGSPAWLAVWPCPQLCGAPCAQPPVWRGPGRSRTQALEPSPLPLSTPYKLVSPSAKRKPSAATRHRASQTPWPPAGGATAHLCPPSPPHCPCPGFLSASQQGSAGLSTPAWPFLGGWSCGPSFEAPGPVSVGVCPVPHLVTQHRRCDAWRCGRASPAPHSPEARRHTAQQNSRGGAAEVLLEGSALGSLGCQGGLPGGGTGLGHPQGLNPSHPSGGLILCLHGSWGYKSLGIPQVTPI